MPAENNPQEIWQSQKYAVNLQAVNLEGEKNMITKKEMNSYRLTSMEEPTDEMLAQIMREAADIYRKENEETQKQVEARLRSLTQEYEKEYELEYGTK